MRSRATAKFALLKGDSDEVKDAKGKLKLAIEAEKAAISKTISKFSSFTGPTTNSRRTTAKTMI